MLWRQEPRGYDPKDFPNYKLYQNHETGFQQLLKQWPAIFTFIAWSFTFLFSILTIINEWFWMIIRDPFQYGKANAWIIKQYHGCPTVFQMTYGAILTVWFFSIFYRVVVAICDVLLYTYNDPVWAYNQVLTISFYVEDIFFSGSTLITCTIFNFAYSFIVLLHDMSVHSLSGAIVLLIAVALFQLHHYLFVYNPEATKESPEPLKGILKDSSVDTVQSPKMSMGSYQVPTPPTGSSLQRIPYDPPWRSSPGRCFRVPTTPSTGSTTSSSPDPTPFRRRPSPKSNKPHGASYVTVPPASVEKLRADGYGVPEPTRETTYSWDSPTSDERLAQLRRRAQLRVRPSPTKFKEVEQHKAEAEEEARFVHSIVPNKTQWVYSSLDVVKRRMVSITDEVTELRTKVDSFNEAGIVRRIPEPSDDLEASPRTQKREATLTERERIKTAMTHYVPEIENAAMAILKQQHGVEELLARVQNLIAKAGKAGCAVSRAILGEVEDNRVKVKNMFGDARQTLIKARSTEELCEGRRVKLTEEANRLKRLDRAHLLLLEINAKKREIEMHRSVIAIESR
ncbi:hypothetical protein FVEN_g11143 [Fusarium venenatum]|uniref:Uncharacterized protein n=1 Tax=Fusarium venenatum TaxID=56646 RepID=A0A2L2TL08_9HYPO|nr:uncharacterized protein FVRRES_08910 [Fusarium venenatum]KAG8350734.1 hypothetical protein FVEN_g11143 [Fusarium venenatum]KAH6965639.1 hypothetical protein EDB82DRAFT_579314 [Fusarium venenatum]CEI68833.1 unnamed protein product [Fusarium venenatum]